MFGNYEESMSRREASNPHEKVSADRKIGVYKTIYGSRHKVGQYPTRPPTHPPPTQCSFMQFGYNIVKVLKDIF